MLLDDLGKHISAQEETINKLSEDMIDSTTYSCVCWNKVWERLWGKPLGSFQKEEAVKRDKFDPVDDIALPGSHLVATLPESPTWNRRGKQILVRSEYHETEQATLSSNESCFKAFVITGQPGIGKSDFLLWLLMRRLALRLPTVLQLEHSRRALIFHESGVFEFTDSDCFSLNGLKQESDSSRIWALVDTPEPAGIFRGCSPFFVVLVACPLSDHTRWLSKIRHKIFYMKPWSISEILQARALLPRNLTERQLWHMHNEFGASLRSLVFYADALDTYESHLLHEIGWVDRTVFWNLNSHYILTIVPSPTRRSRFVAKIPSRRVFKLLWERLIKYDTSNMAHIYNIFRESPISADAAGWIFEFRMHQLLKRQQTVQLFPVLGRREGANLIYDNYIASSRRNNPTSLQSTWSKERPFLEGAELQKDHYYRLESTDSTIGSLLFIQPPGELPILLVFQIIHGQGGHDVNVDCLRKINNSTVPPGTRRYYVVVTPEDFQPKIVVPTGYFGDGGQQMAPDRVFPVFHYPVRKGELFAG